MQCCQGPDSSFLSHRLSLNLHIATKRVLSQEDPKWSHEPRRVHGLQVSGLNLKTQHTAVTALEIQDSNDFYNSKCRPKLPIAIDMFILDQDFHQ